MRSAMGGVRVLAVRPSSSVGGGILRASTLPPVALPILGAGLARTATRSRHVPLPTFALSPATAPASTSSAMSALRSLLSVASFSSSSAAAASPAKKWPPFAEYKKHATVAPHNKVVMIGFGSIGKGVLPLLLRHLAITPAQIRILTPRVDDAGAREAKEYGVTIEKTAVTQENYTEVFKDLKDGDFLLNLSVDVSSIALIQFAKTRGILYLDTCIEPWPGSYQDKKKSQSERSNYALRELSLKEKKEGAPTAVVTHGANPGFVSYFTKQALLDIARDTEPAGSKWLVEPSTREQWGALANQLGVKVIHIAERDTQYSNIPKKKGEFVNTWSIDGFVSEGCYQPAELGWGSHEKTLPFDGARHEFGCGAAIYIKTPGSQVRVRTWTPLADKFLGFLVTHSEAISIADYFTLKSKDKEGKETVKYRPTVHYAYHPCDAAVLSLHENIALNLRQPESQRLMLDEIVDGVDELGVLLMGHKKGAYWYGSQLSVKEAREIIPYNNATSLQVCIAVFAGVQYAINNPRQGVVDADEIPFRPMLEVMRPYLGPVVGKYTDWNPLHDRNWLWTEDIDSSDPWQFKNFRVLPPLYKQ